MERNTKVTHLLACDVEAKRVTSKGNVADVLSRGFLGELRWYEEVKIEVPHNLRHLLKQVFPLKDSKRINE